MKLIVLVTFFTTLGILSRDISAKRNVTIDDALRNVRIKKWTADSTNEHSNRRIFFHETSGRSRLTLRQCCAVESAAKNNPTRPVELYLSVDQLLDFDQIKACVTVLDNYPNVDIFLVDNDEYFKGTVLENW